MSTKALIHHLKKLDSSEDDNLQKELAFIARVEPFAADMVVGGALLTSELETARLTEIVQTLSGVKLSDHDSICDDEMKRDRTAYYFGLAVGLKLARAAAPIDKSVIRTRKGAAR